MLKILIASALLFLSGQYRPSGPVFSQAGFPIVDTGEGGVGSTAGSTATVTFSTASAGDTILCHAIGLSDSLIILTDNGVTVSDLINVQWSSSVLKDYVIGEANAASGPHVIVMTLFSQRMFGIACHVYSGASLTTPFFTENGNNDDSGSSTALVGAGVTTTGANNYVIGILNTSVSATYVLGSGYTPAIVNEAAGTGDWAIFKPAPTAGFQNPTATASAGGRWVVVTVVLQP